MKTIMKITMHLNTIKACRLFASEEKTRYYLGGVFFEAIKGSVNLVATDGHRLIKFLETSEFEGEDVSFIIPSGLIDKIKYQRGEEMIELEFDAGKIVVGYNGDTFKMDAIDGTYPDYHRVIPTVPEDEKREVVKEIGFQPKFLGDFEKVNKLIGRKGAGIRIEMIDSSAPVTITCGGIEEASPYLAVLMPMRV